jgi:hypothetical protein
VNRIGGVFFQDFEQPDAVSLEFTPSTTRTSAARAPTTSVHQRPHRGSDREGAVRRIGFQITDRWDS